MGKVTLSMLDDEVLNKAMQLFWLQGYSRTTIDEIASETGLHRAAIYKNFRDKDALFLALLKRYRHYHTEAFTAPLRKEQPSINNIRLFITQFIDFCHHGDTTKGCFLIATASDLPSHLEEVRVIISEFISYLRGLFYNNLTASQTRNEIAPSIDCNIVADFLVSNVFGATVMFRAQAPKQISLNHLSGVLSFLSSLMEKT